MIQPPSKITLKSGILKFLYSPAQVYYKKIFESIRDDNYKLNKHVYQPYTYSISYNNKKYPEPIDDTAQVEFYEGLGSTSLDKSLYERMDQYIEDTKNIREESKIVKRFLTILMNAVVTSNELEYLLGPIIYEDIQYMAEAIMYKDPLKDSTKQRLDKFKIENKEYFNLLNQRIIDNSLMSSVYNG